MYRFIESIRLNNGVVERLPYHQARVDRTFAQFFPDAAPLSLQDVVTQCPVPAIGLHKLRLVYDTEWQDVRISFYQPRVISSLQLVHAEVDYAFKFKDRSTLTKLLEQRGDAQEIIIVKDGKITDSSYANLAVRRKDQWVTPAEPLLPGTMRQFLLDQKILELEHITPADLSRYNEVKLINALLEFDAPPISVQHIRH